MLSMELMMIHSSFLVGTYIVEYDYIAKSADELTIRKGDIITDAAPSEDGWLRGECRGSFGFVRSFIFQSFDQLFALWF